MIVAISRDRVSEGEVGENDFAMRRRILKLTECAITESLHEELDSLEIARSCVWNTSHNCTDGFCQISRRMRSEIRK